MERFVAEREGMFCEEIEEVSRRYLGCSLASDVADRSTKKENHTLSEDLCGFLACYPKIVFPSFELCIFFSEQCILTSDIRPALSEITLETWDHF